MDHKLTFGTAVVYENSIEVVIEEGQVFDENKLSELFEVFNFYFSDKKFGYISNRKYSYSIDLSPAIYNSIHENMAALAVVCYSPICEQSALFEKQFYRELPFEVFATKEEAYIWIKTIV
ncbi:hypothetical protein F3C99_03140 [Vitellibacter sp. q18]|nr:hypothetical protein [Aequorivita lutea]